MGMISLPLHGATHDPHRNGVLVAWVGHPEWFRVADGCVKRMAQNIKLEAGPEDDVVMTFKMLRVQYKETPDFAIDAFTAGYPVTRSQAKAALDGSIPVRIDTTSVTLILS